METLYTWFLAWAALCGGFWALFDRVESVASENLKSMASKLYIMNWSDACTKWPELFMLAFDSVFGRKHLSWRRFYRSCIASVLAVGAITLIFVAANGAADLPGENTAPSYVFTMIIGALILNSLPDYFSLIETRMILTWMSTRRGVLAIVLAVVADAVLTLLIFIPWFFLITVIAVERSGSGQSIGITFVTVLGKFFSRDVLLMRDAMAIFLYSTFLTSAWLWLYAGSAIIVKLVHKTGKGLKGLQWLFKTEEKPFRTLGFASTVIITACFVVEGLRRIVF